MKTAISLFSTWWCTWW